MTDASAHARNILVVDDEDIVQSLVRDTLEDEGHSVQTASNGAAALEIIKDQTVDLLITDIRMPKMTGIELVDLAREVQPSIGVIFITGYASLNSAKDAIKKGALDYVLKPFELSEIRQAVNNAIEKLSEAGESSSQEQLNSLSDLSHMLFAAGDRKSLVTSSLKFAMMHQHSDCGSILYRDNEREEYVLLSICNDKATEESLGNEPLESILLEIDTTIMQEPCLLNDLDEHPLYKYHPNQELRRFLMPQWKTDEMYMLTLPVMRSSAFYGLIMLESEEDTFRLKQNDVKFLSITASQLAISLENVALLEETRQAYARLKELQDETIELEKMAARGEMSAEIGHELNNFLGVVAGNVALLDVHLKKEHYDQLDKYLTNVNTTIEKIKIFTSNLMDLRSISSKMEKTDFDKMITEVVEYLRPQKRFRGVSIHMPEILDSAPFQADSTQIQQLLYNLFNNAADATESSETREIHVSMEAQPEAESFRFSIEDTGCGFDPENVTRAFQEKFTTKATGHGFGLVVCKRIIDNHGGKLEVESAPGEGTRISVTFPMAVNTTVTERTFAGV